jgi:hypothetical protein
MRLRSPHRLALRVLVLVGGAAVAAGAAGSSCLRQYDCATNVTCAVAPEYCEATIELESACAQGDPLCGDEKYPGCCEQWALTLWDGLEEGRECVITLHLPDGGSMSETVTKVDSTPGGCAGSRCDVGVDPSQIAFP